MEYIIIIPACIAFAVIIVAMCRSAASAGNHQLLGEQVRSFQKYCRGRGINLTMWEVQAAAGFLREAYPHGIKYGGRQGRHLLAMLLNEFVDNEIKHGGGQNADAC